MEFEEKLAAQKIADRRPMIQVVHIWVGFDAESDPRHRHDGKKRVIATFTSDPKVAQGVAKCDLAGRTGIRAGA
jgi:hypothetical protein